MKTFTRQEEAFQNCLDNEYTFAVNYNNSKACFFVNATEKEFWDEYMVKGPRNNYEKIRMNKPCHLYIDLDKNQDQYPELDIEIIWSSIKKYIAKVFVAIGVSEDKLEFVKLHSHSEKKQSLHIIIKIQGMMFKNLIQCGHFMKMVVEDTDYKDVIDLSVYSKNRNFRMLGCTKAGQKRYLEGDKPLTFEYWISTKIQPLTFEGELIELGEDEKETVISTHAPQFVIDFFRSLNNDKRFLKNCGPLNLNRIVYKAENQSYHCTSTSRWCPFQKRQHQTNHPRVHLDLIHCCYHIKCFSKKHCKHKKMTFKTKDMMTEKISI